MINLYMEGIDRTTKTFKENQNKAIKETLEWTKVQAKNKAPKATNTYSNSFRYRTYQVTNGIIGRLFNDTEYASYADKGRRPGRMPPVDAIKAWCRVKGIPENAAYPIALKIAREGTIQFKKNESYLGIDYQGNLIPGGLIEESQNKFFEIMNRLVID